MKQKIVRGLQIMTREKIAETKGLTAEMRLNWLEDANEFLHAVQKAPKSR